MKSKQVLFVLSVVYDSDKTDEESVGELLDRTLAVALDLTKGEIQADYGDISVAPCWIHNKE